MTALIIVSVLAVAWSVAYALLDARSRRDAACIGAIVGSSSWVSLTTWSML